MGCDFSLLQGAVMSLQLTCSFLSYCSLLLTSAVESKPGVSQRGQIRLQQVTNTIYIKTLSCHFKTNNSS